MRSPAVQPMDWATEALVQACQKLSCPVPRERIEQMLDSGARLEHRGPFGATPLVLAAAQGNGDTARVLIERGADVNACNLDGHTALFNFAKHGNEELCQLLLQRGARHDLSSASGLLPMQVAAQFGRLGCCALFVSHGIDPDCRGTAAHGLPTGDALHQAAEALNRQAFLDLVVLGCTPAFRREDDLLSAEYRRALKYPLHFAALHGHTEACLALLEKGWSLKQKNSDRHTPLRVAVDQGHEQTASAMRACAARLESLRVLAQLDNDVFRSAP